MNKEKKKGVIDLEGFQTWNDQIGYKKLKKEIVCHIMYMVSGSFFRKEQIWGKT